MVKDGAGAAASSGSGVAADASTGSAAIAETSRTAAARRQPPRRVVRKSPSALSVAVFLSKKGKLVRKKAGPSSSRRVPSVSRLNRPGSVLADPCGQPHRFTLKELREITNDFSDEQLLGEGAFGEVYKGVLKNGDTIAVKKLKLTMAVIQDKQYENEARHMMRLKHPNIVQLVGYCSETKKKLVPHNGIFVYAEDSERLLCLEYLPKGNLRGHLSDESSGLDWSTRYKIMEGICYGLHYLHEEWQAGTPIIHRDLKPENILLDDNMVPKIADFGLSRLFGEEQTRTCTRNCKGTLGYMAPEYIDKGIITKKLDIFSLGVIIIEIMTGRKEYPDESETSSQQYIELVLNKWWHRSRLEPGYTYGDNDYLQIKRCIQIGLLCVKFDQAKRPTIRQIIKMLDGTEGAEAECIDERKDLVDKLKGSAYDQLDALHPDYVMTETDSFPRPLTAYIGGTGSSAGAGPSNMPSDCYGSLAAYQVAGVPTVGGSSHTQIEPSIANTNMDPSPSFSIPDHHNAHQYQAQVTRLAGQEQFSSASLSGSYQEPVGPPNSCSWTTKDLYHEDEVGRFLNQAVALGSNQLDIENSRFWQSDDTLEASTSSQGYMMLTTQQPAAGASAQGSMQSQMQAPLPQSNDASVASASAQQALPPQEREELQELLSCSGASIHVRMEPDINSDVHFWPFFFDLS